MNTKRCMNTMNTRMNNTVKPFTTKIFRKVLTIESYDKQRFQDMISDYKENKVFFSGKDFAKSGKEEVGSNDAVTISVVNNPSLTMTSSDDGGILCVDKESGNFVYAILPRRHITKVTDAHEYIKALKVLEEAKPKSHVVRGGEKEIAFEGKRDGNNYLTVGLTAKRSGRGLYDKTIDGFTGTYHDSVLKRMRNCTAANCSPYIPRLMKESMKGILDRFELDPNKPDSDDRDVKIQKKFKNFFPSLSSGRNVCLELHADEDAFLSVTSVYAKKDVEIMRRKKTKKGSKNVKRVRKAVKSKIRQDGGIVKYFTFEVGHTVGLRSGDILMFNPLIEHCVSSSSDEYADDDVHCISYYFKSLCIGLNDNTDGTGIKEEDS